MEPILQSDSTGRADVLNDNTGASHQLFLEAQSLIGQGRPAPRVDEPDQLTMSPIDGFSDRPGPSDTVSHLMENPPTEPIPRTVSTSTGKRGELKVDCKPDPKGGFEGPRLSPALRHNLQGVQG